MSTAYKSCMCCRGRGKRRWNQQTYCYVHTGLACKNCAYWRNKNHSALRSLRSQELDAHANLRMAAAMEEANRLKAIELGLVNIDEEA